MSRIDDGGEELWWSDYIENSGGRCYSHIQCNDGGFALVGCTSDDGRLQFLLVRTNEDGEMMWTQAYGGEGHDECNAIVQTLDGGFVLGGNGYLMNDEREHQFWIIRTDRDGNELETRTYGGFGMEKCYSIVITNNRDFALAGGTTSIGEGSFDFWLVRTDEEGEEIWSQTYGGEQSDMCYSCIQTTDGGFALAGYTRSFGSGEKDFWLVKTDENGELQWSESYGGEADDECKVVIQVADGGFVLGGTTESFGAGGEDFWLVRTNEVGEVFWSGTYGGERGDELFDAVQTMNGGYALTGGSWSFGDEEARGESWLMVTEPDPVQSGALQGQVFDFIDDVPLGGAVITASNGTHAETDEEGFWRINIALVGDFDLTASLQGYNDSTLTDLHLDEGEMLEIDFRLLHPEFMLSDEELIAELRPGELTQQPFSLRNDGNGPLHWSVEPRLAGEAGAEPWTFRNSLEIGEVIEDSLLLGTAFIEDRYYITGGGNDANLVYVLNREGDLVNSFNQFGDTEFGMHDLTYDGELLWGTEGEMVYGFTTEGDLIASFAGPFHSTNCIAYDPDRERLWFSGVSSDIVSYDRQGAEDESITRWGLRIFGLAYWSDDPDGHQLYILSHSDESKNVIHKVNLIYHRVLFVKEYEADPNEQLIGAFFTDRYDIYGSWVNMSLNNSPDDSKIDIIQLKAYTEWMIPNPTDGILNAQGVQELELTLNSSNLSVMPWEGELLFSHNAVGGLSILPVTLDVNLDVTEPDQSPLPTGCLITGIYPNPFNSSTVISFELPVSQQVSLRIYDMTGRLVALLADGKFTSGSYDVVWDQNHLPSGLYITRLQGGNKWHSVKIALIK